MKIDNENVYGLAESIVASGLPTSEEVWKSIHDFPDYEVSNLGRVRSNVNKTQRILKQAIFRKSKKAYFHVNLHGVAKNVHRLVAEAFIPNPQGLPQVNHKDENKKNNRADNLEWCSCSYNCRYSINDARRAELRMRALAYTAANGCPAARWAREHKAKAVVGIVNGEVVCQFNTMQEAERITGISANSISKCVNHRNNGHGYVYKHAGTFNGQAIAWRFADANN